MASYADPSGYTGFVNFQRRFRANQDVANREAGDLANDAQGAAEKAAQARQKLEADFKAKANPPLATINPMVAPVGQPSRLAPTSMADAPTVRGRPGDTRTLGQANVGAVATQPQAPSRAYGGSGQIQKVPQSASPLNAAGKYAGPGSLGEVDGYEAALKQNQAADRQLSALSGGTAGLTALLQGRGVGAGAGFDAALLGQAGGERFRELRRRFNLEGDWKDAEKRAADTAAAGKKAEEDFGRASAVTDVPTEAPAEAPAADPNAPIEGTNAPVDREAFWNATNGGGGGKNYNAAYGIDRELFDAMTDAEIAEWQALNAEDDSISKGGPLGRFFDKRYQDWMRRQKEFRDRLRAKYGR